MTKYFSKKTIVDGITFHSKDEASRYLELKLLQRAGEISDLVLQPEYELQPKYKKNGKNIREISYIADFSYIDNRSGEFTIEDVKGFKTKDYILKKKIFEYVYPDWEIKEI